MKIASYRTYADMLRETYRVIHEQNLKQLQHLNHQREQSCKVQQVKNQWARPNSVDVMV